MSGPEWRVSENLASRTLWSEDYPRYAWVVDKVNGRLVIQDDCVPRDLCSVPLAVIRGFLDKKMEPGDE